MDIAKVATTCPECDKRLRVAAESVGRTVRCPGCQHRFILTNISFSESGKSATGPERSMEAVETLVHAAGSVETSTDGQFPRPSGPPATGKIGRFELHEILGRGGFGIVYRARDPLLDREVALKVPLFSAKDQKRAQRFINEARAAARLRHPNIVAFYEIGEADDKLFLAAEYIQGRTLADVIRKSRPPIEQCVRWVIELAGALEYAHSQGIVHRDIKPHNIMIDRQRKPQIMDFGLAKRINQDSTVTIEGSLLGTPAYMPPEQARGELEKIGPHSDQYSLGVVLYELLAGAKPFEGTASVVIAKLVTDDPVPPTRHNPEIPNALEAICLKAMQKKIEDRFPSVAEFSRVLAAFLDVPESASPPGADPGLRRTLQAVGQSSGANRRKQPGAFARFPASVARRLGDRTTIAIVGAALAGLVLIAALSITRRSVDEVQRAGTIPSESTSDEAPPKVGLSNASPGPLVAPFTAEQARDGQQRWGRHVARDVHYENSMGMHFVLIPPGEFLRGASPAEVDMKKQEIALGADAYYNDIIAREGPQHRVSLTRPYYLGVYEVTQAQFALVMGRNPSHHTAERLGALGVAEADSDQNPVDSVTWFDAVEFCNRLSELSGLRPAYQIGADFVTVQESGGYRLPTGAEWEFACRAGTTSRWWNGDSAEDSKAVGWQFSNSGQRTHRVGELPANPFGLFDIHGNVWEWCQDGWDDYEPLQRNGVAIDPQGPAWDSNRVLRFFRGGDWINPAPWLSAATRFPLEPDKTLTNVGFRVLLPLQSNTGSVNPAETGKTLASTQEVAPKSATAKNLLKPIDDPAAWRFDVTQGAEGTHRIVDKTAVFTVSKPTNTGWHAQLVWPGLHLRPGTEYAFHMRARSPQSRHLFLKICIDRHDWHPVGLAQSLTLAPQARDFDYRFRAENLTENQQLLVLELGHAVGDLVLEELTLSEVSGSGTTADQAPSESRVTPNANLFRPLTDEASWKFQVFAGAQGMASIVDGAFVLKVTKSTGIAWHAQATRVGLHLSAGKNYLFRMRARSPEARAANVYIGINRDDWHDIGFHQDVKLTTEARDYEFRFQARTVNHPEQRLVIDMGQATGEMIIEELSLTEDSAPSNAPSASSSPTKSPPPAASDALSAATASKAASVRDPNHAIREQTKARARLPVDDDFFLARIRSVTWRRTDVIEPVYLGTLTAHESVMGSIANQLGKQNLGLPTGLAFHPDGRLALAYGAGAAEGMALLFWNQRRAKAPEQVFPITYAPYDSKDEWDKTTGREAREAEGKFWYFAGDLAFDEKGTCYFTQGRCGPNGLFRVNPASGTGSTTDGRRVTRLAVIPSDGGLQVPKFDPDHAYVNSDDLVTRYALEPPHAKDEWLRFATEQMQGRAPQTSVDRAILLTADRVLLILKTPHAIDRNRNQSRAAVLDLTTGGLFGVGVAGKANVNFSGPVEAAGDGTTVVRFDSAKREILKYRIDFSPLERNGP